MGKTRKLTIATDSYLPRWDGISRFLSEVIPRIERHYEIKVIAPAFKGEFEDNLLVDTVRIPLSKRIVADYPLPRLENRKIKESIRDADIVWTQTIGPIGSLSIIAARKQRKKTAAYVHSIEWELVPRSIKAAGIINFLVQKITSGWARYLYNKCDLLIVPSKGVEQILEKKGITPRKAVISVGTDTKKFSPPMIKEKAKEDIGIDPKTTVVGFVGRIGHEKDIQTLYRAFSRIHRKHNTILLIAGQDLAGVTKGIPQSDKVMIIGGTNNVVKYLQAIDIYVLPSLTETSSLSTMEAMSCGAAVISTPVGAVKEYLKDGENGLLFRKQDPYDLSQKLETLMEDSELRTRLGQAARRTIIEQFSWENTAKKIEEALDGM